MGLQIREDPRDELGEMSVVIVRKLRSGYLRRRLEEHSVLTALALLRLLFLEHRCIVAVQVFDVVARVEAVLDGLALMRTLKRLTIVVDPDERRYGLRGLVDMVQSVDADVRVDLRFIDGQYYLDVETSLLLILLAQPEARIAALDLTGLAVGAEVAGTLIEALLSNNSVTELAVGSRIFAPGLEDKSSEHFAKYLTEKKTTLRKLSLDASDMKSESCSWNVLHTLVLAICEMTSLEELTVDWLCSVVDFELFGTVVGSSQSLRSLHVRCRRCCDEWVPHWPDSRPVVPGGLMERWVSGLKSNRNLQRLTVDLSLCTAEQCCSFMRAIAVNVSIETVTVRNVPGNGCLPEIYATIRECGVKRRVVVEDHHVDPSDVKGLRSLPEANAVTLSSLHFPDAPSLCAAFGDLTVCSHVTSLRMRFESYDEALYSAAADYLGAAASTVNDVELYANDLYGANDENRVRCPHRLIEALASMRSVTKLKVHVTRLSNDCCQLIADLVLDSRILYQLSLEALDSSSCSKFLQCLLPGLSLNYSLLAAALPDFEDRHAELTVLHEATRRNWLVVDRASRFVIGDHDPYCKSALRLVSDHPKLVETVARKAAVTEVAATVMVKDALQLLRLANTSA